MNSICKVMFCAILCCFFASCNNTEEHNMQKKIEKGFDGSISEEDIAKGFKGNNTPKELRKIAKDAKQEEEKTQQDGIKE